VLDLRISGRPNAQGSKALAGYAERPAPDTLLLVQIGRLDRAALNGQWVKALDRAGVVVQVWPLNARESLQWIASRLVEKGLKAGQGIAELIAERAQGNLLAADQEIVKLSLLYRGALPDKERLLADITDSARFNVFELADAAIAGDCARAVRILHGLAAEDVKPALVLWSLSEQTRLLALIAHRLYRGVRLDQAIPPAQQRRGMLLRQALKRQDVAAWEACLRQCARADRMIKGPTPASAWDELLALTFAICGRPLFCIADERD
jgi:DNA polymerase-3 subunit delta